MQTFASVFFKRRGQRGSGARKRRQWRRSRHRRQRRGHSSAEPVGASAAGGGLPSAGLPALGPGAPPSALWALESLPKLPASSLGLSPSEIGRSDSSDRGGTEGSSGVASTGGCPSVPGKVPAASARDLRGAGPAHLSCSGGRAPRAARAAPGSDAADAAPAAVVPPSYRAWSPPSRRDGGDEMAALIRQTRWKLLTKLAPKRVCMRGYCTA